MINRKFLINKPLLVMQFLFLLTSCSVTTQSPEGSKELIQNINIDEVGWTVLCDVSLGKQNPRQFLNLYLKYDENLDPTQIKSLRLSSPIEWYWDIPVSNLSIQQSTNLISIENYIYYGANEAKIMLGEYTVYIKMENGQEDSISFLLTEPGTFEKSNHLYISALESIESSEIGTLISPDVEFSRIDDEEIEVVMIFSDNRINNVAIWFYDIEGKFLGESNYLVKKDGNLHPNLDRFFLDGTVCTFSLKSSNLSNTTLEGLDSVASCVIVVQDGGQYAPHSYFYDHRTITGQLRLN